MSVTLTEIREAIATNLDTIPNVQVSAYMLGNPTPPTLWLYPDEADYDTTMQRGGDCLKFLVQGIAGLVADQGAQMLLDQMLAPTGSTSVKAAIESDKSLGGLVGNEATRVVRHRGYQIYQRPNVGAGIAHGQLLGAEWEVEVYT